MYRISVTTLEKFRRFMAGTSSFDTEESLLESLRGIFKGNDKTRCGSAYHKLIEGEYDDVDGIHFVKADGYTFAFTPDQAKPAIDFRKAHPNMVHELDIRQVYNSKYFPIQVTGRVDGLEGLVVRDAKTKYRAVDQSEYVDSIQWKFYCDMLNCPELYYDVFEVKGFPNALPDAPIIYMPKEVQFIPFEPIHCLAYDGMREECISLLELFLDYLHTKKLVGLLKPAIVENQLSF